MIPEGHWNLVVALAVAVVIALAAVVAVVAAAAVHLDLGLRHG